MIRIKKRVYKIAIITIILIFCEHISYAKYINTYILKGKQEIAQPIFEIEEGIPIKINNENTIGTYEFLVKNFKEENISEVGFLYTIEIVINENLKSKVKVELYNEESNVQLINFKTEPILLNGNNKNEHKYRLNISYNQNYNQNEGGKEVLESIFSKIQININAEQEKI